MAKRRIWKKRSSLQFDPIYAYLRKDIYITSRTHRRIYSQLLDRVLALQQNSYKIPPDSLLKEYNRISAELKQM